MILCKTYSRLRIEISQSLTVLNDHVYNSSAQQDAVFELISMGFNVALWYTKYASRLAGKEK